MNSTTATEIWFKVRTWGTEIEPVEIERASEVMVFLPDGRREKQISGYHGYFKTAQGAKAWRIRLAKAEIARAEHSLASAKKKLVQAEALKVP